MAEKEVCSPVSRVGSKVGSGQPMSPGARSNPSRGDSVPSQPHNTASPVHSHDEGNKGPEGSLTVTGPED